MAPSTAKNPPSKPSKKKFAEDAGLAHLLSLSRSITDAQSQLHQERIDTTKSRVKAQQARKREQGDRKKERATVKEGAVAKAKSKAEIKAELKAQFREKARLRKEKRKESRALPDEKQVGRGEENKVSKKKSVSFALA